MTVPQPCLKSLGCRRIWEHSFVPRMFGRVGFNICDKFRSQIMLTAFVLSTIGWIFSIVACVALSNDSANILNTYWASGDIDGGAATYYVGLSKYVVDGVVGGAGKQQVVSWKLPSACNSSFSFTSKSLGGVVTSVGNLVTSCTTCQAQVLSVETMVIMGAITQVFQMTTNLQRSTR